MKKNISKNIYLRYKFQTELLDILSSKGDPVKTTDICTQIPHFKHCKVKSDEFHMMYEELSFLEKLGLCTICDNEGVLIDSTEKFIKTRFERNQPICSILTEKGIEAVQNRTYESLYISTYLNYRMYKLSIISILLAFLSIIIAIIAVLYPLFS